MTVVLPPSQKVKKKKGVTIRDWKINMFFAMHRICIKIENCAVVKQRRYLRNISKTRERLEGEPLQTDRRDVTTRQLRRFLFYLPIYLFCAV